MGSRALRPSRRDRGRALELQGRPRRHGPDYHHDLCDPALGPFTVAFDLADAPSKGYHRYLRRSIIRTPLGLVELEPLAIGYDAVFGMCSVFQESAKKR